VKRINFKKLVVKNFLSIGEEELYMDFTSGISLITEKIKTTEEGMV
jgi:hypothetical protein